MKIMSLNFILEICESITIFLGLVKTYTNAKVKYNYYVLLLISFMMIGVLSIFLPDIKAIVLICILHLFVYFALPVLTIEDMDLKFKIYLSLLVVGIVTVINCLVSLIVSFFDISGTLNEIIVFFIRYLGIFLVMILFNNKTIKTSFMNALFVSKQIKTTLLFSVWLLALMVVALKTVIAMNQGSRANIIVGLTVAATMIMSWRTVYLLISNHLQSSYYKRLNDTMETHMTEQTRHYLRIIELNDHLQEFKHDFKNMVIGLNTYLQNNEVEQAKKYLAGFAEIAPKDDFFVHTGNPLVNALISDKLASIKENNITIDFEGLIPQETIDSIDLCIVFGNALDNAIEACTQIKGEKKKTIVVSAKKNRDMFFVKITNPVAYDVRIINNTVSTTKPDAFSHGMGLYSIRKVVKKYSGNMKIECKKKLFIIEMDFVLEKAEESAFLNEESLVC